MGINAVIYGCSGLELTDDERAFFASAQPWGFILFGRNVDTPQQVAKLVADLKSCVEHDDVPVLIDQEGGRVRRLRPPHWPDYYRGSKIGEAFHKNAAEGLRFAWLQSRLMAFDLVKLGINVDCLPVLDVPVPGSHDVIGDRAYSHDPEEVALIGGEAARGLLDGGVMPVIKHIPGHGRAGADSHLELPRVSASLDELRASDLLPFHKLAHMPMAMTAHVVYEAIDRELPATISPTVISEIIRGEIGFDGLLMTDDIAMQALSGELDKRSAASYQAGCDVVLHCGGSMDEMQLVQSVVEPLEGIRLQRAERAFATIEITPSEDEPILRAEFDRIESDSNRDIDPTEVMATL